VHIPLEYSLLPPSRGKGMFLNPPAKSAGIQSKNTVTKQGFYYIINARAAMKQKNIKIVGTFPAKNCQKGQKRNKWKK